MNDMNTLMILLASVVILFALGRGETGSRVRRGAGHRTSTDLTIGRTISASRG